MHHRYRQSLWRHFLNWNVPFPNGSSLCQVDIKLSHKCLFCFCLNLPPTSPCGSVHIPLYFICLKSSRPPVSRCGMNRWVNGNNEFSSFLQHPQGCRLIWESVVLPQKQQGIGTLTYLWVHLSSPYMALFSFAFSFINYTLYTWSFHQPPRWNTESASHWPFCSWDATLCVFTFTTLLFSFPSQVRAGGLSSIVPWREWPLIKKKNLSPDSGVWLLVKRQIFHFIFLFFFSLILNSCTVSIFMQF